MRSIKAPGGTAAHAGRLQNRRCRYELLLNQSRWATRCPTCRSSSSPAGIFLFRRKRPTSARSPPFRHDGEGSSRVRIESGIDAIANPRQYLRADDGFQFVEKRGANMRFLDQLGHSFLIRLESLLFTLSLVALVSQPEILTAEDGPSRPDSASVANAARTKLDIVPTQVVAYRVKDILAKIRNERAVSGPEAKEFLKTRLSRAVSAW